MTFRTRNVAAHESNDDDQQQMMNSRLKQQHVNESSSSSDLFVRADSKRPALRPRTANNQLKKEEPEDELQDQQSERTATEEDESEAELSYGRRSSSTRPRRSAMAQSNSSSPHSVRRSLRNRQLNIVRDHHHERHGVSSRYSPHHLRRSQRERRRVHRHTSTDDSLSDEERPQRSFTSQRSSARSHRSVGTNRPRTRNTVVELNDDDDEEQEMQTEDQQQQQNGGDMGTTTEEDEIFMNAGIGRSSLRNRNKQKNQLIEDECEEATGDPEKQDDEEKTEEITTEEEEVEQNEFGGGGRPRRKCVQRQLRRSVRNRNLNMVRNHQVRVETRSLTHRIKRDRQRRRRTSSPSPSSSSDEEHFQKRKDRNMSKIRNMCLPMNFNGKDLVKYGTLKDRQKAGASLADIDPMSVDSSVLFDKVGGLEDHVKSLKEMILFPLLYPEVFEKYKIHPPRGVLFHGPPGTGKTLVARALANECSTEGKKVAFFMRKGADCMSKWVGESERQLRLLFDQAYTMRPSIIFFDEIDGIAPVRSTRQDQIHSSIVSTLLALMDGLDSRGEVVIIGATNRLEAIDPALRRPGRFDREFFFPLPSYSAREEILTINTREWKPPLEPELISTLAKRTVGYCGADLKALCAETALISLHRRYPQIYTSKNKLLLNVDEIKIELRDFNAAIKKIIPASQRSTASSSRPLTSVLQPLLNRQLRKAIENVKTIFPSVIKRDENSAGFSDEEIEKHLVTPLESPSSSQASTTTNSNSGQQCNASSLRWPGTFRPRFLLYGPKERGHSSHLAPALLHTFEHVAHLKLDLSTLHSVATRTPEESLTALFSDAMKRLPCIIYIPHINRLWEAISDSLQLSLISQLDDLESSTPLLLLATSDSDTAALPEDLQDVFSTERSTIKTMEAEVPTKAEREKFFTPLFKNYAVKPVEKRVSPALSQEPLPEAPSIAVTRKLSDKELKKLRKKEDLALRQLRLFLGEVLGKIIKDRRFSIFVQPIDEEEVPDYYTVIQNPMDLSTMIAKLDQGQYQCAQEFLGDIELIMMNALEYNPAKNTEDRMIRHAACALNDFALALIEAEMDSDFETVCQEIVISRKDRGETKPKCTVDANPSANVRPQQKQPEQQQSTSVASTTETTAISREEKTGATAGTTELKPSITSEVQQQQKVPGDTEMDGDETEVESDKMLDISTGSDKTGTDADRSFDIGNNTAIGSGNNKRSKRSKSRGRKRVCRPAAKTTELMETENAMAEPPNANGSGDVQESDKTDTISIANCSNSSAPPMDEPITQVEEERKEEVLVDQTKLDNVLQLLIQSTDNVPVERLEKLYWSLFRIIQSYTQSWDRTSMAKKLSKELDSFVHQQNRSQHC